MPQLFTPQHYDAFTPPKPDIDGPLSPERLGREQVKEQFLWLDSALGPFIEQQGWDLHRHHQKQHYTSSTHFIWINVDTGEVDDRQHPIGRWQPIVKEIGWLWLHYGKSKEQLNLYKDLPGIYQYTRRDDTDYANAFYMHARIQFYLSNTYFGAWLVFTEKNIYDKSEFLKKLKSSAFRMDYWARLQPLLDRGFTYVSGDELPLTSALDQERLFKFIRKKSGGYSGIRKIYEPNDPQLDVENIVEEMKTNLRLLYPLYDLMSHRQIVQKTDLSKLFGGNVKVQRH